jgi:hypothetical protein
VTQCSAGLSLRILSYRSFPCREALSALPAFPPPNDQSASSGSSINDAESMPTALTTDKPPIWLTTLHRVPSFLQFGPFLKNLKESLEPRLMPLANTR